MHFWNNYIYDEGVYLILIILLALYVSYLASLKITSRTLGQNFNDVKDLVRGTVTTDLESIWEAYKHFKKLKGVKIIEVKELDKMNLL